VLDVVVGTLVVDDVVDIVVGTVVGSVFGSPTFQLRLVTGNLTNPAVVTVKLPRSVYVVPATV
jgi:hypothetical protein